MNSFSKTIGAIAAYWAIFLLGPAVILIMNNLGYLFTGGGYSQQSLMYKVLVFFAQPVSCYFAYSAAKEIYDGNIGKCVTVNCVLGTIFCGFLVLFGSGDLVSRANMIVSLVVCVVTIVYSCKQT